VFEAVATPAARDDLGLEAFWVEADGATQEDIETLEWDAGDMSAEDTGEGFVGWRARAPIVDACKIGVEVEGLRHRERFLSVGEMLAKMLTSRFSPP
jgi:hypothetical protein